MRSLLSLLILLAVQMALPIALQADTLVHNVRGYTMDDGQRRAFVALEFNDVGRITRIHRDTASLSGSTAEERIDGGGATLLPGLIDAHGHVARLGERAAQVDLVGTVSEEQAADRVRIFASNNPGEGWLFGGGWNQVLWPGRKFPTRQSLDAAFPDRPVVMDRVDGHAAWVNTAALREAGITDDTPDPEGGQILRDDDGHATGVLIDNAANLVLAAAPLTTVTDYERALLRAQSMLLALGLTSVHDAGINEPMLQALQNLRARNELKVRIYAMLDGHNDEVMRRLGEGPILDDEDRLVVRSIKLWSDGALGSRGAALFDDYHDDPGNRGLLLLSNEELQTRMSAGMEAGFQVNVHAIGDRANDVVLNYYEQLAPDRGGSALRHRIEHAQVLRPRDLTRLLELGIVASIQPTHATSDKNMAANRLGTYRLPGAYAYRTFVDMGTRMAGGSDFPIESANPFFGLHAAVTRQDHGDSPPGGWLPEQRLTRDQALSLFTEDAAWAAYQEDSLGRLAPGHRADFILVRDDYFGSRDNQLWRNKVLQTWIGGEQVYTAAP